MPEKNNNKKNNIDYQKLIKRHFLRICPIVLHSFISQISFLVLRLFLDIFSCTKAFVQTSYYINNITLLHQLLNGQNINFAFSLLTPFFTNQSELWYWTWTLELNKSVSLHNVFERHICQIPFAAITISTAFRNVFKMYTVQHKSFLWKRIIEMLMTGFYSECSCNFAEIITFTDPTLNY